MTVSTDTCIMFFKYNYTSKFRSTLSLFQKMYVLEIGPKAKFSVFTSNAGQNFVYQIRFCPT